MYTVILWIAVALQLVVGFQQISVRQELYVLNGQGPFYGNNSVTVQCEPGDYDNGIANLVSVLGFDGVERNAWIKCNQAVHLYALDIKGYTFYDGQLQSFIYALVPSNWNWNNTNGAMFVDPQGHPLNAPRPTHVGIGSGAPSVQLALGGSSLQVGGTYTNPDGGANVAQCGATQAVNQFLGGFLSGFLGPTTSASGCGGPYISLDNFNNYVKSQNAVNDKNLHAWEAQDEFNSAVNDTVFIISQGLNAVNASLYTISRYVEANNQLVKYNAQLQANTTNFVTRFANDVNKDLLDQKAAISKSFQLSAQLAANMASFVNHTSTEFEQVTLQMAQNDASVLAQLEDITAQINYLANQAVLDNLDFTTQMLRMQSLVINSNQNTQLKRDIAQIMANSINYQIEQKGRMPFLPDFGTPPPADISDLPPAVATTAINVITRQFLYNDPMFPLTQPTLAVIQFAWKCSTAVIGANPTIQGSFVDTLNSLRPANCTGPVGAHPCLCWVEVTDTRAPIQSAGGVPDADALEFWRNGMVPSITPYIPNTGTPGTPLVLGGSAANIRAGIYDGRRITSSDEYIEISEAICRLNISDYYVLDVPSASGRVSQMAYRVYSAFNHTSIVAPWDNSTCYINIQKVMQPPVKGPYPPFYAEMQFAQTAYNLAIQQVDPVVLFGSVPNRLTWDMEPTATLAGGVVNAIWRYYYMAFVPLTLTNPATAPYYGAIPVWQLTFVSTTATISVSYDGASGPFVTYPATNVFNAAESTLFGDGYVGMGDPMLMWDGTAPAFNAPQQVLALNPTKPGVCGTPIYNMMNAPQNMTYMAWVNNAGIAYDHRCGSNVARFYETALIDSGPPSGIGQCDANPNLRNPTASGTLCNTLTNYVVTPNQDGTLITLALAARGTSSTSGDFVQGIVTLPAGEVRDVVNTACPTATQVITGYNTIQVVFTNGLTKPNTIRVTRLGQCPVTQRLTLPPLGPGSPFIVAYCPGTPEGQEEQLRVETLGAGDVVLTVCNLVNVTVDYQQQGILQSPATAESVRQYSSISIDQTSTTQQAILTAYVRQTFAAVVGMYSTQLKAGLQIPQASLDSLRDQYNAFVEINRNAQEALANNTNRAIANYSGHAQDYETYYLQNAALAGAARDEMEHLFNELNEQNARVSQTGEALSQQALIISGKTGAVASNVTTLAEYTNRTANFHLDDGSPITLGDLLGEFISGFAEGIGDGAEALAKAAGSALKSIAEIPAGLLRNLITTILGPIIILVLCGLVVALAAWDIGLTVIVKKLLDRVGRLEAALGINRGDLVSEMGVPGVSNLLRSSQSRTLARPPSTSLAVDLGHPAAVAEPTPAPSQPQMAQMLSNQSARVGGAVGRKGPASHVYEEDDRLMSDDDEFDPRAPLDDHRLSANE